MQKARTKLGNVEYKLMFRLYKHSERFSSQRKEMYYATVSLYVQTFVVVCRINRSENLPQTTPNIRTTDETKVENQEMAAEIC